MNIIITSLFGMESLVREDLSEIGYTKEQIKVTDGVITLTVPDDLLATAIARVNMWVRHGERVFFEVGSFTTTTFEDFFDNTKALPWADFIPDKYCFTVNGYSRKSVLFGIPACQSLAKKAIAKSLCKAKGLGDDANVVEDKNIGEIRIQFGIVSDVVTMMIDTTGDGLHKRGYRPLTHEAPIRETLASAMVSLARFRPFGFEALVDPMCGSGTILIEAALKMVGAAPGRLRHFAYENIPYLGSDAYFNAYEEAKDLEDFSGCDDIYFYGSDIDSTAIYNANKNAEVAGVGKLISFHVGDVAKETPDALLKRTGFDRQLVLTNPPYGGRLLTLNDAEKLYKLLGSTYLTSEGFCKKGIRLSVISPDDSFEVATGFKADKRFKLYNGNIKCQLNSYFKMKK